jgi:hypothetical protein
MPHKQPRPKPEDLAFPPEAEQLEIVVLLKEGRARTFRDLLPVFGGSIEAVSDALWALDEGGFTVPSPVDEEGDDGDAGEKGEAYLDEPITFTKAGRAATDAISVAYDERGRRRIEIHGSDGSVYTVVRSASGGRSVYMADDD